MNRTARAPHLKMGMENSTDPQVSHVNGEVIDLSFSTCHMERTCSGWMVAPQRHNCLECRNMALLGGKVITNVIKDFKGR